MGKLEDRLTNGILDRCDKMQGMVEKQISLVYPTLTRKYIEKMVKPLQWEEQTMHCFGTKDLKAIFHGLVFLITPHYVEQIRGLKTFHLTVHGTLVYVTQNNDKKKAQDELKQYAQKWLVDFVCSALGVEE